MREPTEVEIERAKRHLIGRLFLDADYREITGLASEFAAIADEAREQGRAKIEAVMRNKELQEIRDTHAACNRIIAKGERQMDKHLVSMQVILGFLLGIIDRLLETKQ
jgi:hypothetical protein